MKNLNQKIIACERCPRLRKHCQKIAREKRKSFEQDNYWGKPVPNFGDPKGEVLIVGLAPAAHGANRTGRMFTGDRSGEWLYRALHKAGLANQSACSRSDDGLKLKNCLVTAVAHCAPPDNKPTPKEILNCQDFFDSTLRNQKTRFIIALGSIAWQAIYSHLKRENKLQPGPKPKFAHGARFKTQDGVVVVGSYHPSQQNTFTGRLTEEMLDNIFSSLYN